jgi:hypothetical protein
MMALVERSWSALEAEATGFWADNQMRSQHYLRNFPGQTFYYFTNKGFLTGKKVGSHTQTVKDQHLLGREKKLLSWLDELPRLWQAAPETAGFVQHHPQIDVLRQITMVALSGDLIHGIIFKHSFACDSPEVHRYLELRNALVGNDDTVLSRMKDKKQAATFYDLAVNTQGARYLHYSLQRYCGLEAAGQEDMSRYRGTAKTPEEWRNEQLQYLFPEQTQILEEMHHGR